MTLISDLFSHRYGHSLELNRLEKATGDGTVNFVGRAARGNGVTARVRRVEGVEPAKAGCITVALGGQGGAGVAFLQPFPFYCGRDVMILTPLVSMTEQELLWWVTCISANRFRFGFGRQANKTLPSLVLPSSTMIPDWVSSGDLGQFDDMRSAKSSKSVELPHIDTWKPFKIEKLFDIEKGARLTKQAMNAGQTAFVAAIDSNNGVRQAVDIEPNHKGNTITVNYNGSVAEAFYQPSPYWASDDVNILYPKFPLNPSIGLFICTLIRREKFRFSYGRKWHLDRMNEAVLRLPVGQDGEPDYALMKRYIDALPFSRTIDRAAPG